MSFKWQELAMRAPDDLMRDLMASVVVFLVALPLCMGIAIACNMPPATGLITGIIGGIMVCSIGGSRLQVSGPAAGLVVTVGEVVGKHGLEGLALVILMSGGLQIVAGIFGIAQWFRAVPPSVIHGMLSGIGVLIFASQFHVMVDDAAKGSGINNLMSIPGAIMKGITPNTSSSHEEAAVIGLLTISLLVLWDRVPVKALKRIPGSLIAVVAAAIVAAAWGLPIKFVSLPDNLLGAIRVLHVPTLSELKDTGLIGSAFLVAFIASAETLLTAAALDKLAIGSRTNYDRELIAQGVGNSICGVLGVLPMTGVMVRSGVNVAAGARTRLSGFLHGVWLLLFVSLLPWLVRLIPTSCLAALLVYTGYKLANFKVFKELKEIGRWEAFTYFCVVSLIVSTDLLTGVLAGVVLSIGKLLYTFSHLEVSMFCDSTGKQCHMNLRGAATFLSLPKLAKTLEQVKDDAELHVHLDSLDYIDHACLDLLMNWDKQQQAKGGTLVMDWTTLGHVFRDRRRTTRADGGKQLRRATVGEAASES